MRSVRMALHGSTPTLGHPFVETIGSPFQFAWSCTACGRGVLPLAALSQQRGTPHALQPRVGAVIAMITTAEASKKEDGR